MRWPRHVGAPGRSITGRRPDERSYPIRRYTLAWTIVIVTMVGLMSVPAHANRGTCSSHRCLRHARYLCSQHQPCRDRLLIAHMGIRGIGLRLLIDQHRRGQWPCLDYVIYRESRWDPHAVNPSSGAAGLGQSLGHGYVNLDDPRGQLVWVLHYMDGRYGSPCAAAAFWRGHNWY